MQEASKFSQLLELFQERAKADSVHLELPIRSELYNWEELRNLARELSTRHQDSLIKESNTKIYSRFQQNQQTIDKTYEFFYEKVVDHETIPPGAEWLLDNYYVICEQIREIQSHLPKGFYKQLPKLNLVDVTGLPRVYHLVIEYISHTDALLDTDSLGEFIDTYQKTTNLKIGELWAIPIMFRLGLIENLRRISQTISRVQAEKELAKSVVDELLALQENNKGDFLLELANKLKDVPQLLNLGAVYLITELRSYGRHTNLSIQWIEEKLREKGYVPSELMQNEEFLQASNQITIGNTIRSLKNMGVTDWHKWFEQVSRVESKLKEDASGVYRNSDFTTRNLCRNRIEALARKTKTTELDICDKLYDFFNNHRDETLNDKKSITYYLISDGYSDFLDFLNYKPGIIQRVKSFVRQKPLSFYQTAIWLPSIVAAATIGFLILKNSNQPILAFAYSLTTLIICSELFIQLLHWLLLLKVTPQPLPKLDHDKRVSAEHKTVVAINTILKSKTAIDEAIGAVEVRHLANEDRQILFAILADLPEGDSETMPGDERLLNYGQEQIAKLNAKYAPNQSSRFFLLFRKRVYSQSEEIYMGWERKRGKLAEFNRLLLHKDSGTFITADIDLVGLDNIKYVLTLDADTVLPAGSARKLIATIAHPLNQAEVDPVTNSVKKGYAILQPQLINSIASSNASIFAKISSANTGIDPYSSLVSEVYQDVFGEGSFTGKGIYDLAIFEKVLCPIIPEEALLSHDLFEGNLLRCGLVSDIVLIENIPSKYNVELSRFERWTRGDWQILPWLFKKVPNAAREKIKNPISALGRWKIIDNLRRSIMGPVLLLGIALALFNQAKNLSNLYLLFPLAAILAMPVITQVLDLLFRIRLNSKFVVQFRYWLAMLYKNIARIFLQLSFLPKYCWVMLTAIVKTLYRIYFSKKNVLEWMPADFAEANLKNDLPTFIKFFWPNYLIVAAGIATCLANNHYPAIFCYILAPIWLSAPYWAYKISQPTPFKNYKPKAKDKKYLQTIAYDTWQYFEDLLTEEYNYLIPDNIQMVPEERVAVRTSPTNIGLSMLTVMSAYDMGFIDINRSLDLVDKIICNVKKLDSFSGQLYNWYNPQTLAPLNPHYISFVDSSNFIAYCLAGKQALKEFFHSSWLKSDFLVDEKAKKNIDTNELSYFEIYQLAENYPAEKSFAESHPWLRDLFSQKENFIKSLTGEALEKTESLYGVLEHKSPTLTLSKKINLRIMEIVPLLDIDCPSETRSDLVALATQAEDSNQLIDATANLIRKLINDLNNIIANADFSFLYNKGKQVFSIGYNLDSATPDNSYYDLLASEARLGSLTTIALKKAPLKHWFHLGRNLTNTPFGKTLYSWTGTTFEYRLPNLLCKDFNASLITESCITALKTHVWYGKKNKIPWGISESAHAGVDFEQTYQYRAFGVPELSLKRGMGKELVVSPYSTMLTLDLLPKLALQNLDHLKQLGAYGKYGFYEAIDFSPARLSADEDMHVVETFFAHHQGMSLVAINNFLNDDIFQKRFHSDPRIKAVELLLHERFPIASADTIESNEPPAGFYQTEQMEESKIYRSYFTPFTKDPVTHLVSNGYFSTLVDNAGNNFNFLAEGTQLNAWDYSTASKPQGEFVYIKDLDDKSLWSNTYQPTKIKPSYYEVTYNPDKIDFKRQDQQITCHTEITVSPEYNLGVRRLHITNLSNRRRRLQLTSCSEVALARYQDFNAHPAFLRTFVETRFIEELDALIFTRKPRKSGEITRYMFHQLSLPICWHQTHFECDRLKFMGRYRNLKNPLALYDDHLGDHDGAVLDPVSALQTIVEIAPGFSAKLAFITGYSDSIDEVYNLLRLFHQQNSVNRTFDLAWSKSNIEIRNEHFTIGQSHRFQMLANAIFYQINTITAPANVRAANQLGQSALWRFGISGDNPMILLEVHDSEDLKIAKELLLAHEFLRRKAVNIDLIIVSYARGGYFREFYQELEAIILGSPASAMYQQQNGIFLREASTLSNDDLQLLQSVASVYLNAAEGNLRKQLKDIVKSYDPPEARKTTKQTDQDYKTTDIATTAVNNGELHNSYGQFTNNGKTYSISCDNNTQPPLPWVNVIANPNFGTIVSDSGSGFTWSVNSRENRISSWSNDPIKDPVSEAIYVRDIETGEYWSLSPKPAQADSSYQVDHSFGHTNFHLDHKKIQSDLTIHVSSERNLKWFTINLHNSSDRNRNLELYSFIELTLGISRSDSYRHIVTGYNAELDSLIASNKYNQEFAQRITFTGCSNPLESFSCDRKEFTGPLGDLETPAFLERAATSSLANIVTGNKNSPSLSNRSGAGLDPAFILKSIINLKAGETAEVTFFLGQAENYEQAERELVNCRKPLLNKIDFEKSLNYWKESTSKIEISTPERSFDILMNGWLIYQNLSCRINGRSAFYQSGGAIGFRDQLQDALSTMYIDSDLTRSQIILHAEHQFKEGDVQHWWHPPTGRGTRTRISDDLLWLPYVTWHYLEMTGDRSILEEERAFLEAPVLTPEQHDAYLHPVKSDEIGTILEHCERALDYSLQFGPHGIPLIRGGDWNDGMDLVGIEGKGESVWLGWFLADNLKKFSAILATSKPEKSKQYAYEADRIVAAIEEHAWDGEWYLRAFYDDGTPLGSSKSEECQIDSLAQSWSIITGLGNGERQVQALKNVHNRLIDEEKRIIKLLTPAFEKTEKSPGYIKSYLPGVRENGAQYTHAATWVILATALAGDGDKALELFQLINPIDITSTEEGANRYMGDPYVTCGDVLSNEQHAGRAGWSWYSGSGGWLYRVGLEAIIGLKIYPDGFELNPNVPKDWPEFTIKLRLDQEYKITARQTGQSSIKFNDRVIPGRRVLFAEAEQHNAVIVEF